MAVLTTDKVIELLKSLRRRKKLFRGSGRMERRKKLRTEMENRSKIFSIKKVVW